jgi:hypothetical protein
MSSQFDVAISFLDEDFDLAKSLAEQLGERTEVFLYSDHQREIAGKDGLEEFTSLFKNRSRLCVVLYRNGWGLSKWTGVEETAIKDRGFSGGSGWSFLLVVVLDESKGPPWVPETKIWYGYERFGLEGLVPVIDARVSELGGTPRTLTAPEVAARLAQSAREKEERNRRFDTKEGVATAREELARLFSMLEEDAQGVALQLPAIQATCRYNSDRSVFCLSTIQGSFTLGWHSYSNSLREHSLLVAEYEGLYYPGGRQLSATREERVFKYTETAGRQPRWHDRAIPEKTLSSRLLANHLFGRLLSRVRSSMEG